MLVKSSVYLSPFIPPISVIYCPFRLLSPQPSLTISQSVLSTLTFSLKFSLTSSPLLLLPLMTFACSSLTVLLQPSAKCLHHFSPCLCPVCCSQNYFLFYTCSYTASQQNFYALISPRTYLLSAHSSTPLFSNYYHDSCSRLTVHSPPLLHLLWHSISPSLSFTAPPSF